MSKLNAILAIKSKDLKFHEVANNQTLGLFNSFDKRTFKQIMKRLGCFFQKQKQVSKIKTNTYTKKISLHQLKNASEQIKAKQFIFSF